MHTVPHHLINLLPRARTKRIPAGQIILYEGDPADHALIIVSGEVIMYDLDDDGNRKILHVAGKPSLIPFAFFRNIPMELVWYYEALTDVEVLVIPSPDLRDAMAKEPQLNQFLVGTFATHVHELLVRLSSLNKTNVRDKLLAVLKFMAVCHSQPKGAWQRVDFPVTHQLLADMCGVTRESASIGLKELQDQKIIKYPKLNVLDIKMDALVEL